MQLPSTSWSCCISQSMLWNIYNCYRQNRLSLTPYLVYAFHYYHRPCTIGALLIWAQIVQPTSNHLTTQCWSQQTALSCMTHTCSENLIFCRKAKHKSLRNCGHFSQWGKQSSINGGAAVHAGHILHFLLTCREFPDYPVILVKHKLPLQSSMFLPQKHRNQKWIWVFLSKQKTTQAASPCET